jgi:cell division protein FtsZ
MSITEMEEERQILDFGAPVTDKTKNIIKVIGVGGGGCNSVNTMYEEGIDNISLAVINTDSKALSKSPVPVKVPIGELGAGGDPINGYNAAKQHVEDFKRLLSDGTKMVFVTAGMGGGTGTGAGPVVAGIAKQMGILTVGVVTIPFYFEKRKKIIQALKGVEEMRKNVDALLIINNERINDIYSDTKITIKEAFNRADHILCNATKSISELITIDGTINLDFKDVETTMHGGGGAIMAIGRASGEHRVEKAFIDALNSPLLYRNDITKAKRILFNIYTSDKAPLFVSEMNDVDDFMDRLDPNIDVIWGTSDDNTLEDDAKITILATGFDECFEQKQTVKDENSDEEFYEERIKDLYKPIKKDSWKSEKVEKVKEKNSEGDKDTGSDDSIIDIYQPKDEEDEDNADAIKSDEKDTTANKDTDVSEKDRQVQQKKPWRIFVENASNILHEMTKTEE